MGRMNKDEYKLFFCGCYAEGLLVEFDTWDIENGEDGWIICSMWHEAAQYGGGGIWARIKAAARCLFKGIEPSGEMVFGSPEQAIEIGEFFIKAGNELTEKHAQHAEAIRKK